MENAVTFLTLFLGLVLGPQEVQVATDPSVAWVSLRVDDRHVARLEPPEWKAVLDFGDRLTPHLLEAVAFDADGQTLGRAEQWLNLPGPTADAQILLEGVQTGSAVTAQVSWQSVTGDAPTAWRVSFDGQPIEVASLRRFALPHADPEQLHFVRVELDFPENVTALAEATFGGFYADQVSTELTALVLTAEDGATFPKMEELEIVATNGPNKPAEPMKVVALDQGLIDIHVIRGGSAHAPLGRIFRQELENPRFRSRGSTRRMRSLTPLTEQERLFLGSPWPEERRLRDGTLYRLFPSTRELVADDGGLLWQMTQTQLKHHKLEEQHLVDAVAVAGMSASRRNRRRAVVLLLGRNPLDASELNAHQVRAYLEDLSVPLEVWALRKTHAGTSEEWGEVRDVSTFRYLERAKRELSEMLERQHIVWVEGKHLPQRLQLSSEHAGIEKVE